MWLKSTKLIFAHLNSTKLNSTLLTQPKFNQTQLNKTKTQSNSNNIKLTIQNLNHHHSNRLIKCTHFIRLNMNLTFKSNRFMVHNYFVATEQEQMDTLFLSLNNPVIKSFLQDHLYKTRPGIQTNYSVTMLNTRQIHTIAL